MLMHKTWCNKQSRFFFYSFKNINKSVRYAQLTPIFSVPHKIGDFNSVRMPRGNTNRTSIDANFKYIFTAFRLQKHSAMKIFFRYIDLRLINTCSGIIRISLFCPITNFYGGGACNNHIFSTVFLKCELTDNFQKIKNSVRSALNNKFYSNCINAYVYIWLNINFFDLRIQITSLSLIFHFHTVDI